jgi:hypothetical protein
LRPGAVAALPYFGNIPDISLHVSVLGARKCLRHSLSAAYPMHSRLPVDSPRRFGRGKPSS